MGKTDAIVDENIALLDQAISIISNLPDAVYTNNDSPYFLSGVGRHMRHILDFYQNLIEWDGRQIDYDNRSRSRDIETRPGKAREKIKNLRAALVSMGPLHRPVQVKNDDGGHRSGDAGFSPSTIGRELQFLASHTVHHFALVAMILRLQNIQPPADFGIAPSTLQYMQATSSDSP